MLYLVIGGIVLLALGIWKALKFFSNPGNYR